MNESGDEPFKSKCGNSKTIRPRLPVTPVTKRPAFSLWLPGTLTGGGSSLVCVGMKGGWGRLLCRMANFNCSAGAAACWLLVLLSYI